MSAKWRSNESWVEDDRQGRCRRRAAPGSSSGDAAVRACARWWRSVGNRPDRSRPTCPLVFAGPDRAREFRTSWSSLQAHHRSRAAQFSVDPIYVYRRRFRPVASQRRYAALDAHRDSGNRGKCAVCLHFSCPAGGKLYGSLSGRLTQCRKGGLCRILARFPPNRARPDTWAASSPDRAALLLFLSRD